MQDMTKALISYNLYVSIKMHNPNFWFTTKAPGMGGILSILKKKNRLSIALECNYSFVYHL